MMGCDYRPLRVRSAADSATVNQTDVLSASPVGVASLLGSALRPMPSPENENGIIACHFVNDDVGPDGGKLAGSGNPAPPRKHRQAVTDKNKLSGNLTGGGGLLPAKLRSQFAGNRGLRVKIARSQLKQPSPHFLVRNPALVGAGLRNGSSQRGNPGRVVVKVRLDAGCFAHEESIGCGGADFQPAPLGNQTYVISTVAPSRHPLPRAGEG
jgi:hypothetical protein